MSNLPILYSFRRCPYAMRARAALVASATPVELREVALRNKPAAMLAASPKGTVPVLVLPDGPVIEESLAIMRWALAANDPLDWLNGDDAGLIATNDGAFKHHLDRYKYADRFGADRDAHRAAATALLAPLDQRLAAQDNLTGQHVGLADIALMPFIRQFAETDRAYFDALPMRALQAWLARHLAAPLFDRIMVRAPAWQPGDLPVHFGGDQRQAMPSRRPNEKGSPGPRPGEPFNGGRGKD